MGNTFSKLITSYQKSLTIKPENAPVFSKMAEFYYSQGKFEEALTACQQALQSQPNLATASLTLEKARQGLGRADRENITPELILKNWITVDADSVGSYPDGVNQLCKGAIDGMLIKQVFSPSEIAKAVQKFESKKDRLTSTRFGAVELLGFPILQVGIDKNKYFQESALFRRELSEIFENKFEEKIKEILGKISGTRPVEIPQENINELYLPATFRILSPQKGGIEAHSENEVFEIFQASLAYMRQIANLQDSLNYFIVLDKPEQGGELIIYDLLWEQTPQDMKKEQLLIQSKREVNIEKFNKRYFDPDIGDMMLFKGERWHKVSEIEGKKNRISIGGLVTLSKDERKIFYWA